MNETETESIMLECKDCHEPFEFTAGEQEYFKQNGLNPPKRCPMCRLAKRRRYEAQEAKQ